MPPFVDDIRGVHSARRWALVAALCGVGTALRMAAVPRYLGDLDAVNFASGLRNFDVFSQAPHFPGYPVFIAAARMVRGLGVNADTWALALPGIATWPLAAGLLYAGLSRRLGGAPALGAVALGSLAPGAVLVSAWPCSDGLGLSLAAAAVGLLAHGSVRAVVLAGLAFGLLLGVRLSWWPIVLAAGLCVIAQAAHTRSAGRVLPLIGGGCVGVSLWLVPMLVMFPPAALLELAFGFGAGHMSDWGNTAFAADATLGSRTLAVASGLWVAGLGALGPGASSQLLTEVAPALVVAVLALAGLALALSRGRLAPLLSTLLVALPYLLWLVGAQNVDKARHLLPLLPWLGILIAAGLTHSPLRRLTSPLAALGLLALTVTTAARASRQAAQPVPAVAFTDYVRRAHAPAGLLVFAGQEARVARHYAPMYRVVRPANAATLSAEAERASALGVEVWVTSAAPGFAALADRLTPLERFDYPRALRPHDSRLALFHYRPETLTASARGQVHR